MKNILCASMLLVFACTRSETMASKSDAAYREAQAKGTPVAGGHEHGGHEVATETAVAEMMDHSAHGTMDHSTHATMDHSAHGAMDHSAHATMDHSAHGPAADPHAGHDMTASATTDHSAHRAATGAAAHDQHAGMQHGTSTASTDPHAHHRQPSTGAPAVVLKAPATNAEIAQTQPAATLRADDFDAPSPIAVAEAQKAAAGGGGHAGHGTSSSAQTIYTCPMHPEVTSATPGNCPKCGMALVKATAKKEK